MFVMDRKSFFACLWKLRQVWFANERANYLKLQSASAQRRPPVITTLDNSPVLWLSALRWGEYDTALP